ncbi:Protein transport protein SEC23 [Hordeum vulgare]|nr:Protein transport protein SEC23 [Hordeum vulgare]
MANPYPRHISPDSIPAELFLTHSSIEYTLPPDPAEVRGGDPSVIVFVVDAATAGDEHAVLKAKLLRVVQGCPRGSGWLLSRSRRRCGCTISASKAAPGWSCSMGSVSSSRKRSVNSEFLM